MIQSNNDNEFLSRDLLEMQLGQIDLLMAMYPSEENITISESSTAAIESLRDWLSQDTDELLQYIPSTIGVSLQLDATETSPEARQKDIPIEVSFLLHHPDGTQSDAPPTRVRLQQASWMSKSELASLSAQISIDDGDLFSTVEAINSTVSSYLSQPAPTQSNQSAETKNVGDESIVRVWFYFPSISTRSKRDDLVNHAPGYGLTGFLLAGKPGILCLEGGSQAIDDYMKFIKTESWGDIPAHHKKVSERYRQPGIKDRAFSNMQEITDQMERRGERANRNDLRALESWLTEIGLQDAFSKVLI